MQFTITFYCRHCGESVQLQQDTSQSAPLNYSKGDRICIMSCPHCTHSSGVMQINYNLPDSHRPELVRHKSHHHPLTEDEPAEKKTQQDNPETYHHHLNLSEPLALA